MSESQGGPVDVCACGHWACWHSPEPGGRCARHACSCTGFFAVSSVDSHACTYGHADMPPRHVGTEPGRGRAGGGGGGVPLGARPSAKTEQSSRLTDKLRRFDELSKDWKAAVFSTPDHPVFPHPSAKNPQDSRFPDAPNYSLRIDGNSPSPSETGAAGPLASGLPTAPAPPDGESSFSAALTPRPSGRNDLCICGHGLPWHVLEYGDRCAWVRCPCPGFIEAPPPIAEQSVKSAQNDKSPPAGHRPQSGQISAGGRECEVCGVSGVPCAWISGDKSTCPKGDNLDVCSACLRRALDMAVPGGASVDPEGPCGHCGRAWFAHLRSGDTCEGFEACRPWAEIRAEMWSDCPPECPACEGTGCDKWPSPSDPMPVTTGRPAVTLRLDRPGWADVAIAGGTPYGGAAQVRWTKTYSGWRLALDIDSLNVAAEVARVFPRGEP